MTGPATLFVIFFFFFNFSAFDCLLFACSSAAEASLPGALFCRFFLLLLFWW